MEGEKVFEMYRDIPSSSFSPSKVSGVEDEKEPSFWLLFVKFLTGDFIVKSSK